MKTLRLILGDQLNTNHSWYQSQSDEVVYCCFEMRQETDYVKHHIQKIVAFFLAMRRFCQSLQENGHKVIYYQIDDKENKQDLCENLTGVIEKTGAEQFEYQHPDEYRLAKQLEDFQKKSNLPCACVDSEHFLCSFERFQTIFADRKTYLMESFYREMRKEYGWLMQGEDPEGGQWNYDKENRKKLPKSVDIPEFYLLDQDVQLVVDQIKKVGIHSFGEIDPKNFIWATNREKALEQLEYFMENQLSNFGLYQDAMTTRSWSVFHSRLSFALNTKLLHPKEVIEKALTQYHSNSDQYSLPAVEGFIRQILGWREFMRGMYWSHMPEYAEKNYFNHDRDLPEFYWTGDTKMNCLSHAIRQSLDYAYAHHIQRLMITGNFALLAGIHPDQVDEWYLGIYIDAIEWVEITNTRGMSQFADGGLIATKPYVSSANYIHKMSDYCTSCHYDRKKKVGKDACPFNSLYWHFIAINEEMLGSNPRMSMMYRLWDKQDTKEEILEQAEQYLQQIEDL